MKQVRVNVLSLANAAVRKEKRHGRDVIVVSSATLPDDIVMNGVSYPAEEIEKSYATLNGTLAPYGHPKVNGKFVSAKNPDGLAMGYIGAHNENARRENGRVLIDKVIYVDVANRSEEGRAVLAAIEQGEPVHTSTGLLCNLDEPPAGAEYKHVARNIVFDHDAILLNEAGAATPEQGVGRMGNAAGDELEVMRAINVDTPEAINSALEDAERELDWAADMAARAAERLERAPILERIKTAIMEAVRGAEREPSTNKKEDDMAVSDEQFKALSDEVKTLSESMKPLANLSEAIANSVKEAMKPLTDNLAEIQANQKAKDEAEMADHVAAIVRANLLDEESAKELTLNAARKLAEKAKPAGRAAALNSAPRTGAPANNGFMLPKAEVN